MAIHTVYFREALLDVLISKFGPGSKVEIFDRSTATEKLLAQFIVSSGGGFVRSAEGTATLLGLPTVTILETGTATQGDLIDATGNKLMTATCGTAGSNADIIFTGVSLVAGSSFSMQSVSYTFP